MDLNYAGFDAELHRVWKKHSCAVNSCLAFASTQVRELHMQGGRGPPHFVVNGQVCHNIGPAQPTQGQTHRFAQMYFWDAAPADVVLLRQTHVGLHMPNERRSVGLRDVHGPRRLIELLDQG